MYFSYFLEKGDFDHPEKSPENWQRTFTPKFRNFSIVILIKVAQTIYCSLYLK
jgi:hypothetical protein